MEMGIILNIKGLELLFCLTNNDKSDKIQKSAFGDVGE